MDSPSSGENKRLYPDLSGLSRPTIRRRHRSGRPDDSFSTTDDETENQESASENSPNEGKSLFPGYIPESLPDPSCSRHRSPVRSSIDRFDQPAPSRRQISIEASYASDISPNLVIAVLVIIGLVLLYFLGSFLFGSTNVDQKSITITNEFTGQLTLLRKLFHDQNPRLWTTISSSIKTVLNRFDIDGHLKSDISRDRSPSIVLLMAEMKSIRTLNCFVSKLANITASVLAERRRLTDGYLDIDGSDFANESGGSESGKYLLEKKLNGFLNGKASNRVVVLRNIHRLSADAALILHAYCDHENAPFKDAAIYLTAICDPAVSIGDPNVWDESAEHCLRTQWLDRGLNADKVAPVLARIANSVAFIVSEARNIC